MKRYRRRHRADSNRADIVKALRAAGVSVEIIEEPVDLVAGYGGRSILMEVISPRKDKQHLARVVKLSSGRYTAGSWTRGLSDSQVDFFDGWRGELYAVRTIEEALGCLSEHLLAEYKAEGAGIP